MKAKRKELEKVIFDGKALIVYPHGPDVVIEIDGKHHGQFLSVAAALNSAQKYIIETREKRRNENQN